MYIIDNQGGIRRPGDVKYCYYEMKIKLANYRPHGETEERYYNLVTEQSAK